MRQASNLKALLLAIVIPWVITAAFVLLGGNPNYPGLHSSRFYQLASLTVPILIGLFTTFKISVSPFGRASLTVAYLIGECMLLIFSLFWFSGIFFGLWL